MRVGDREHAEVWLPLGSSVMDSMGSQGQRNPYLLSLELHRSAIRPKDEGHKNPVISRQRVLLCVCVWGGVTGESFTSVYTLPTSFLGAVASVPSRPALQTVAT